MVPAAGGRPLNWHRPNISHRQDGVALLTVLLLVAVMAVLVMSVLDDIRFGLRRASNAQSMAQARWYAMGAETLAKSRIEQLMASPAATTPASEWSGRPMVFPIEHGLIQAQLADASTCFNLNSVAEGAGDLWQRRERGAREFETLLSELGIPAHRSAALVDALVDWIDSDQSPGPEGAEDETYARHRGGYRTAGTLLAESSELRAIEGFDAALYARLRPYVCALPTADLSRINVNALREDQALLLVMLTDGALDEASARRLIRARPPSGWSSADAFWAQPMLAGLPPREGTGRIAVRPRFFSLDTRIEYADAQFVSSALLEYAAGRVHLVARRWTLSE